MCKNAIYGSLLTTGTYYKAIKSNRSAFKEKKADVFTKYFAEEYIGMGDDGQKTAADEVQGMKKLDLADIKIAEEQVIFPTKDTAIMTYKMLVKGKMEEKDISGTIYTTTVFANRDHQWLAVLHTESIDTANKE